MRCILLLLMIGSGMAFAQQQVTPDDFSSKQARLFKRVTEAVSTPCCQNGLPVAYHDSGMAKHVREVVEKYIREGKSESQIMAMLGEMRFGPNNDMEIIFTVPDKNLLGSIFWWIGAGLLIGLTGGMFLLLRRGRSSGEKLQDSSELVDKYRDYIREQVEQLG